eukprot:3358041-Rhodomonas_salina.1
MVLRLSWLSRGCLLDRWSCSAAFQARGLSSGWARCIATASARVPQQMQHECQRARHSPVVRWALLVGAGMSFAAHLGVTFHGTSQRVFIRALLVVDHVEEPLSLMQRLTDLFEHLFARDAIVPRAEDLHNPREISALKECKFSWIRRRTRSTSSSSSRSVYKGLHSDSDSLNPSIIREFRIIVPTRSSPPPRRER